MIVKLLMDLIYGFFSLLTLPIDIPNLPVGVSSSVDTLFQYVSTGLGIVACYTHLDYLVTLLGIVLAVDIGVGLYHFVMFIIKKIPMLSIR